MAEIKICETLVVPALFASHKGYPALVKSPAFQDVNDYGPTTITGPPMPLTAAAGV